MSMLDLLRRVTELEAETERLREEVRTAPQWVRTYWREKCEQSEARTRDLEVALDEKIRLHDQCCGCRPPTFCECFGIADMLDLRAALTEPPPPQEEPR